MKRFWQKIQYLIAKGYLKYKFSVVENLIQIQASNGNWNYDPYMHGLANGILLGYSIFADKEYKPLSAPKEWLCDKGDKRKISKKQKTPKRLSTPEVYATYTHNSQLKKFKKMRK